MTCNTIQKNYSIFNNSVPPRVSHWVRQWPPSNLVIWWETCNINIWMHSQAAISKYLHSSLWNVGHPKPVLCNGAW